LSFIPDLVWLAVAFVIVMAGMLAAAPSRISVGQAPPGQAGLIPLRRHARASASLTQSAHFVRQSLRPTPFDFQPKSKHANLDKPALPRPL
jgi:hypothetical protein